MIILSIDTSCDDTCIAILKIKNPCLAGRQTCLRRQEKSKILGFEILSNIISSQVKLHKKYGGVWPYLAKREHQKNLPIVFKEALQQARSKQKFEKPNLIAVTVGPGLEPCLWTGINFAKELAQKLNLKIIPINHIEAHIIANWLPSIRSKSKIKNPCLAGRQACLTDRQGKSKLIFPAICLIVSGGHTQLILMTSIRKLSFSKGAGKNWKYKIIGETRDDAAGECFDKTARILGFSYPGGPEIEKISRFQILDSRFQIKLPRPMIHQKNYDFSFSGLKTAVLYLAKKLGPKKLKSYKLKANICAEIQQAIIDVLIKKTIKAAKDFKARSIILGGGVAANQELRKQFKEKIKKEIPDSKFQIPDSKYCTDNGAMVAITAYFRWLKEDTKNWKKIKADANLKI